MSLATCVKVALAWCALCYVVVQSAEHPEDGVRDFEGGCTVNGTRLHPDETWSGPVGECTTHQCLFNGKIITKTCPEMVVNRLGCYKTEYNYKVQFPHCCPKVKCNPVFSN